MADLRLGGHVDATIHERTGSPAAVPAADLTTHGVIVGMTGSGKTGLGIVLIEEALAAGIPALLIDPKGDLANIALTFPNLSPPEFEPWVNESDAEQGGPERARVRSSRGNQVDRGTCRLGARTRQRQGAARGRRRHHLHPRISPRRGSQHHRDPRRAGRHVRSTGRPGGDRCLRLLAAEPGADRRRPVELARAHPAVHDHQSHVEPGALAGPRRPRGCRPAATRAQGRGTRARVLLPGSRSDAAGPEAQRPARLASLRRMAGRPAHRHPGDAANTGPERRAARWSPPPTSTTRNASRQRR